MKNFKTILITASILLTFTANIYAQRSSKEVLNLVQDKYKELTKMLTNVDLSKVVEVDDNTDFGQTAACSGGNCEL